MPLGELPGQRFPVRLHLFRGYTSQARHLAGMRRENHGPATSVDLVAMFREDVQGIGVQNDWQLGPVQQFEQKAFSCGVLTQPRSDGKNGLLVE